ncbi:flagellar hook-associated protein FlgL [Savagea sp. SN6]|uniref:Flagellar hook-associated protein FlgL n=1 Tax=Savagea serpentis TaxID=2785297 RepID=A0A8J7G318_9BACL|nr:flagellar hook-associated protein FlgL [Savagea serpentis]MBF4501295.1 flagellar hook-associated protein FlgL [Savagea serpentis]
MRVTQSMLSNNMLRNLSSSYNKMGKLQDQLNTGKKVNRPSDDPVVAMKGIAYRHQVAKVEQFKRNVGDVHNWLDSTDAALDNAGEVLKRARELMVNVPTDSMTYDDRQKIAQELKQLQEGMRDIANSKVGDKYIFSGTKTGSPLFINGALSKEKIANDYSSADSFKGLYEAYDKNGEIVVLNNEGVPEPSTDPNNPTKEVAYYRLKAEPDNGVQREVKIEVFDGVELQVNTIGHKLFGDIDKRFTDMIKQIEDPDNQADLDTHIKSMDDALNSVLEDRAVVGARQNRAELMDNRLDLQEMAAKKQMSQNEDIDYEVVITDLMTQESIHRAALSIGARIIQPTLVDFLR